MSEETVRETLERHSRERAKQMDSDIEAVLDTPVGRRILMGLIAKGGVWAKTGCADGDAVRLAYLCGRRDAAADVLAACNRVAPAKVSLAMQENNARIQIWNDQISGSKKNEGEKR